jgi:ring-1,2-phenylacetyl-CoA epoxidase subunit PaaC
VNYEKTLYKYLVRLGDNALILAQRLIEIVADGPELEEELANANFSLDYLGQARMFYTYAAEVEGAGRSEDDFAFRRADREFENVLLVEQANGHFGDVIVRSVLFDAFYLLQLEALSACSEDRLAEIAVKAAKEIRYHLRYCSQWLIRLGDGTEESHRRVQRSLDELWKFTGELFDGDAIDESIRTAFAGPDLAALQARWAVDVAAIIKEATLTLPEDEWMAGGGREGRHSEGFGYLIAEMQHLQRSYPGLNW